MSDPAAPSPTDRLASIADQMNQLGKKADATLRYDLMSDALWWSDERPDFDSPEDYLCLRHVFRYRTSLILESPDDRCFLMWCESKRLFPQWIGFSPERCKPSQDLKDFHHQAAQKSMFSVDFLDIVFRLQSEFDGEPAYETLKEAANENDPVDITAGRIHEIVCSSLNSAGKATPDDCWKIIQECIAESTGLPIGDVQPDTWIAKTLTNPER